MPRIKHVVLSYFVCTVYKMLHSFQRFFIDKLGIIIFFTLYIKHRRDKSLLRIRHNVGGGDELSS